MLYDSRHHYAGTPLVHAHPVLYSPALPATLYGNLELTSYQDREPEGLRNCAYMFQPRAVTGLHLIPEEVLLVYVARLIQTEYAITCLLLNAFEMGKTLLLSRWLGGWMGVRGNIPPP